MTIKNSLPVLCACAALALLSPAALGQQESDAHERAGISIGGRAAYYRNNHYLNNDWYGGGVLRLNLAPAVALEGAVDYRRIAGTDFYPVQGSLLIFLTPQYRLTPYILGGGTWYNANGPAAPINAFGPHAGAGLELFLTRYVSLDGSWRYLWLENVGSGSNYFNRSYNSNGWMFTGGLNFHF